jgi:hypothetical protein
MRVIDIDPELLRRSANAARHASDQGIRHVGFEIEGDVEKILTTLAPQGPYGFTVRPKVQPRRGNRRRLCSLGDLRTTAELAEAERSACVVDGIARVHFGSLTVYHRNMVRLSTSSAVDRA